MQHESSGHVPPESIPQTTPAPPRHRPASAPDRRMATIYRAVMAERAGYDAAALAEETGLPIDAVRRFAAEMVVHANMVDLDMIDHEDATRMGSEALAASLRILGKRHDSITPKEPARILRTVDVMGMVRSQNRAAQHRRLVAAAQTLCPNCGARASAHGGCAHQQLMRADDTIPQGPSHA